MASVLHGSARATPRVRAELQSSKESSRTLAARYGLKRRIHSQAVGEQHCRACNEQPCTQGERFAVKSCADKSISASLKDGGQ